MKDTVVVTAGAIESNLVKIKIGEQVWCSMAPLCVATDPLFIVTECRAVLQWKRS